MSFTFLIIIFILTSSPNLLLQVCSNSTTAAALEETVKSTSIPPKQTSYFYQEPKGPGTYEFGYYLEDKPTNNTQFRNETGSSNGTVIGSYGFLRADGLFTVINYIADINGYRIRKKKIGFKKNELLSPSSKISNQAATSNSKPITTTSATTTEIPGLNLTSGTLPPILVDTVMDKFQIDLSPDASPGDILHPNISEIISGDLPSMKTDKKKSQLGFDVVQNFIPSNFPIAPFQLPTEMPSKLKDD
ncbi:uncharacterized protein LOC129944107 [Eupeodes corollae]|uniref:uncharacterized protein LOC129944107 n=1 Tax=Eupeodes corollae TaxID=290404 RepID=UPI0024901818|nr:uncharacterized protein LOC129944107 [Eupeodes corollae]